MKVEEKKPSFRIPKKKVETVKDKESFIDSLFDDSTISSTAEENGVSDNGKASSEDVSKSLSSSSSSKRTKETTSMPDGKHMSSHSSSSSDHRHKSKSSSKGEDRDRDKTKSHSSSSSHSKSSSSSSKSKSHTSSSSSKSTSSKSSSSLSKSSSQDKKTSGDKSSKSSASVNDSSKSSSSSHSTSSSKSSSSTSSQNAEKKIVDSKPIELSKHHLNPVAERHAVNPFLTDKEKILARLQAIKERTLAKINEESASKGKRIRSEKGSRKTKEEDKEELRVKSKEIIRDIVSSSDEDVPDALGIMMKQRDDKLEKEKISRMAKQAWERATQKDKGQSDEAKTERKRKKKLVKSHDRRSEKLVRKENHSSGSHRKERAHSLSPEPYEERKPTRPKVVRHAGNAAPPPMDFQALLAMAEKKQQEPIKFEPVIKKKKEEEKRPMTQEEKERYKRTQTKEYQHWLKFGGKQPGVKKDDSDDDEKSPSFNSNSYLHKTSSSNSIERDNRSSGSSKPASNYQASHMDRENGKRSKPADGVNMSRVGQNITVNENVLVCGSTEDSDLESPPPQAREKSENPFDKLLKQVHKKKPKMPTG